MIKRARAKVPESWFVIADAAAPPLPAGEFDVVLCRHVLWALSEPTDVLRRWAALLKPGGAVVLIEGHWATGAGLTAEQTQQIVLQVRDEVSIRHLPESIFWGKDITDERYLAISHR